MGRYYSGDIEGKFWFAVQPSNDASFFGGQESEPKSEPNYINYYFNTDNLQSIKDGIKQCKKELDDNLKKINIFFKKRKTYNDKQLSEALEVNEDKTKILLEWYARLELGKKILKCVKEKGECYFEAEL